MQHEDWRVGAGGEAVRKTVIVGVLPNGWYKCNHGGIEQESTALTLKFVYGQALHAEGALYRHPSMLSL